MTYTQYERLALSMCSTDINVYKKFLSLFLKKPFFPLVFTLLTCYNVNWKRCKQNPQKVGIPHIGDSRSCGFFALQSWSAGVDA